MKGIFILTKRSIMCSLTNIAPDILDKSVFDVVLPPHDLRLKHNVVLPPPHLLKPNIMFPVANAYSMTKSNIVSKIIIYYLSNKI